jgi:hypothetical protein
MNGVIRNIVVAMLMLVSSSALGCSVLYYVDARTGKVYALNNEDYWYHVDSYIQIIPAKKNKLARLWYGWDNFAQGGINEAGLFFDGAVTPQQLIPSGYGDPNRNIGDEILATCRTVNEAIQYMEKNKIALKQAHIMFGDKEGNAVILEWLDGVKKIISIQGNHLLMTNFLLSDTARGNYPCRRFSYMEAAIGMLEQRTSTDPIQLKDVGNVMAVAVQLPAKDEHGKEGGTLYSTFINISDMEFVLVYKMNSTKIVKLDLKTELEKRGRRKIKLTKL